MLPAHNLSQRSTNNRTAHYTLQTRNLTHEKAWSRQNSDSDKEQSMQLSARGFLRGFQELRRNCWGCSFSCRGWPCPRNATESEGYKLWIIEITRFKQARYRNTAIASSTNGIYTKPVPSSAEGSITDYVHHCRSFCLALSCCFNDELNEIAEFEMAVICPWSGTRSVY